MDTVLVIEDSQSCSTLQRLFEANHSGSDASDGPSGLEFFLKQLPALWFLSKPPGISGKELCREFKALVSSVPILILSASSEVNDKVLLLELGADDYVTKPFSPKELLARVFRAMRRTAAETPIVSQVAAKHIDHEILTFVDRRVSTTLRQVLGKFSEFFVC
jgi:DNA-binding response OmpR family regulator